MSAALCAIALCAAAPGCKRTPSRRSSSLGPRLGDALSVGSGIEILAARGETLRVWGDLQLARPPSGSATAGASGTTGAAGTSGPAGTTGAAGASGPAGTSGLAGTIGASGPGGISIERYTVAPVTVRRPSTAMYGGGGSPGAYPDLLSNVVSDTLPRAGSGSGDANMVPDTIFSVVSIARDAPPGVYRGTLRRSAGTERVTLTISPVTLPEAGAPRVWAYYDPRELAWANLGSGTVAAPSDQERACIAMFRSYGVLLSPDMKIDAWPARKPLLAGSPVVPAILENGRDAADWIAATQGTGQVPFAIPIDEPHSADDRAKVRALATEARAAGAGPGKFLFAVTDEPRAEYGGLVDLYITLRAKRADTFTRWTYNGAPPRAGSMVVDAERPGPRTWGWIAHRWNIPIWYIWDALYWHDRHNRKGAPLPGKPLDIHADATSFDQGGDEDHGNLDGVLAFPGTNATPCLPSVRLTEIARGMQDRQLIELAAACDAAATDALVAKQVPTALGDAPDSGPPSWPTDEASWEHARRDLISIAARCAK